MNYHASHEEICPKFIQILAGRAPKRHPLTNSFILVAGQDINGTHFGNRMFVHVLCTLYTAENERTRKLQNDKPLSSTTIRLRAAMAMVLRRETVKLWLKPLIYQNLGWGIHLHFRQNGLRRSSQCVRQFHD